MSAAGCQRWRERRESYRPQGEIINPAAFGVELLREREARPFVERHHYSSTYPAARRAFGLMRARKWFAPELCGVAVFSVPAQGQAISKWLGLEVSEGVELGRFVLLDDVAANGETFFLARALAGLRAECPEVRGVLSYSDPLRRVTSDGEEICPGHVGTIYQAANALYLGRSTARALWLDARGRTVSERALSKIRCQERGWEGAMRALLVAGAPARRFGEEPDAWLARALSSGAFRRTQHPGNHAYALRGLTSSPVHPARAALLSALASSQEVFPSYPKMREEVQP
jgi:hypothetical protein